MLGFFEDLMGGPRPWEPEYCWQDREIRFDVNPKELMCRASEVDAEILVRATGRGPRQGGTKQLNSAFSMRA